MNPWWRLECACGHVEFGQLEKLCATFNADHQHDRCRLVGLREVSLDQIVTEVMQ